MKNTNRKFGTILLLLLCFPLVFSQDLSKRGLNKTVEDADIFFYYEKDYEKAAQLYEAVQKIYPENSNIAAKLGICYLNLDGRKTDALNLLIKASANIAESDKEYTEFGEKAPLNTIQYLAVAYHQNDSLQKAISLYTEAKKRLSGFDISQEDYINNQIRDCMHALEMKKKPLTIISDLFAPWLDEYPGASNPVLSKNDSVFIFTLKKDGKTSVHCSYKSGTWQRPVDITAQLGGFDRFYTNSITGDGKLLVIYLDDGGDGNLYYSQRQGATWTKIKSFGRPVNTIYWESHGFITPNGRTIYIASNRPGGEGELDIWISVREDNGSWQPPVNCGNVINTPWDENTPFFDPTDNALLFSSLGHISMGNYDVFRSVNRNGVWTNPVGMPYAFNNTASNTFFILNNNAPGFITSLYNNTTNSRNIYAIVAEDPADKITLANGYISLQDGMSPDPKQTQIKLMDLKGGVPEKNIQLTDTASFSVELKPGDYQIFVSHTGYKTDTINLNIPLYFLNNYISVKASLLPGKVYEGEFLSIKNILFEFDSYDLDVQAISNLEHLKTILVNYPQLRIEIAGYTDSKGSTEYNRKLADRRAQSVINYLTKAGIADSRCVKNAYGESNFVAVNTYSDGMDNPEGRKYNRRATFGIIDPRTGIIIRQDNYIPEHLRQPHSTRYNIVLMKTKESLYPGYFSGLIQNDLLFVRTIKADDYNMYVLGVFYNNADALKYLALARERGLDQAYILNQYDLDEEANGKSQSGLENDNSHTGIFVYSVQVKATRNPVNIEQVFNNLEGIHEIKADDGFYKYIYGEFNTISKAKEALLLVKKSGYEDAFIRQVEVPLSR